MHDKLTFNTRFIITYMFTINAYKTTITTQYICGRKEINIESLRAFLWYGFTCIIRVVTWNINAMAAVLFHIRWPAVWDLFTINFHSINTDIKLTINSIQIKILICIIICTSLEDFLFFWSWLGILIKFDLAIHNIHVQILTF